MTRRRRAPGRPRTTTPMPDRPARPDSRAATADRAPVVARIDPAAKSAQLLQLGRAKGQVDGIVRMIEQDRYCVDVIVQIIAARASLQAVARDLLKRHLSDCHTAAVNNGGAAADAMYQELVGLVSKMSR